MNAADRRIVHKVADEHGLSTESVGFGRDRHVIIKPVSDEPEEVLEPKVEEEAPEVTAKEEKPKKKSKKAEEKEEESSEEE
jgi:hypothetical protein